MRYPRAAGDSGAALRLKHKSVGYDVAYLGRGADVEFLRLWWFGYTRPSAFVEGIIARRGWLLGFGGQGVRVALDSLLEYLPVAIMGRVPPTPPVIPIPANGYYWFLVFAAPTIIFAQMLLGSLAGHAILRALGRESDLGFLVNVAGMTALVVGAVIVVWDWTWFALGFHDQVFLGITHLLLDGWGICLSVLAMRRRLGVPVTLGIGLNIVGIVVALSLAVPFMRSPF